uniref:Bromodomain containing 1b n=1 Tax=Labrus bergylta TaxID=56723 RepID=A0A3Q3EH71_9LABR
MKKKGRHHRPAVLKRDSSPIKPSPNRETLTYAEAQRIVELEVDGRVHRLSIYDKLDIMECNKKLFLVHFFDSRRSWQWLPRSKMAPFGINQTLDRMKLKEARCSSIRKAVRLAFERAMDHLNRVSSEHELSGALAVTD